MQTRSISLELRHGWMRFAAIGVALALGLAIPNMGLPQPITGPLINALLILTVEITGVGAALWLGMLTPMAALARGVLPLPLMAMIPFIALGNGTLVVLYGILRRRNYWLALGVAAVAKFALLYATVSWLAAHPLQIAAAGASQAVGMPAAIVNMMQWPQLATALAGGVIAYSMLRLAQRH